MKYRPESSELDRRAGFDYRRGVAPVVIAAMLSVAAPAKVQAAWQDNSGNLPGLVSGKQIALIAGLGGGAVVGLLFAMRHKGAKTVKMDIQAPRFKKVAAGQFEQQMVTVTNLMGDPITVKSVSLQGESGHFSLQEGRPTPFTVAPGEQVGVPVTFAPKAEGNFNGHLRIVASSPKYKNDTVKVVSFSSGSEKSGK